MIQKIVSRYDGRTLYKCEAESLLEALQAAVKSYATLSFANLYNAKLNGKSILDIIQLSGIGSARRCTTAIILADSIDVTCGCFHGDLPAFVAQIEKTHAGNPKYLAQYRAAVAMIEACAAAVRPITVGGHTQAECDELAEKVRQA